MEEIYGEKIGTLKKKLNVIRYFRCKLKTTIILLPYSRMANIKNMSLANAGKNIERTGLLMHCWLKCKMVRNFWKFICQFF